jgi:hypothetical protein
MTSIRRTSIRKTLPVPSGWPEPPDSAAYHGLAGEIVQAIAPHTEADPVAVLVQLLVAYGALIGGDAWFKVEAARHYPNEFAVLVGDSAVSRKGSALGHVKRLLGEVEEDFPSRVKKGLSSGEGVVWLLRDRDDGEERACAVVSDGLLACIVLNDDDPKLTAHPLAEQRQRRDRFPVGLVSDIAGRHHRRGSYRCRWSVAVCPSRAL